MLWDYLSLVILNWEGEVVIIGDFNEVRDKSERFGSVFNRQGAYNFNSFISSVGLVEVPLGGCSFTWCHKSATKMSKLDRFLIYDNLMCLCPNISSSTLDRYLSDHRPILMREVKLNKECSNSRKRKLKAELADLDLATDKGDREVIDVNMRHEVFRLLQNVEKIESLEVAQKAKIKWAIEGDENS
nr:RNA-directed DNA polymerase, eukaryota [Tanacetum cinerariifolium]